MDFYTAIALVAVVLGRQYTALQAALAFSNSSTGAYLRLELASVFAALGVDLEALYERYLAKQHTVESLVKRLHEASCDLAARLDHLQDEGCETSEDSEWLWDKLNDSLSNAKAHFDPEISQRRQFFRPAVTCETYMLPRPPPRNRNIMQP